MVIKHQKSRIFCNGGFVWTLPKNHMWRRLSCFPNLKRINISI